MIIRPAGSAQLLITQPDHAALSAAIMRRWRAGGLPDAPRRASILLAIEEHDNGWREVDAVPIADRTTGCLLDFINAPVDIRRGVWPRGVERLAATPYAAALVAQHAIHIYRRYRDDPSWSTFFSDMEAARNRHLERASVPLDDLLREYVFLRIADLASLTFCNGWTEPQEDLGGYTIRFDGTRLVMTPDPFEGGEVALNVAARELPDQPFRSASALQRAFSAAPIVVVNGVTSGG